MSQQHLSTSGTTTVLVTGAPRTSPAHRVTLNNITKNYNNLRLFMSIHGKIAYIPDIYAQTFLPTRSTSFPLDRFFLMNTITIFTSCC